MFGKNVCVRHSLKFHGVVFNEGLKLPRKTSDIAGFLNKTTFFFLPLKLGHNALGLLARSVATKVKGESECSLMKKIQDQSRIQPDLTCPTSWRNKRSVQGISPATKELLKQNFSKKPALLRLDLFDCVIKQGMNFRVKLV